MLSVCAELKIYLTNGAKYVTPIQHLPHIPQNLGEHNKLFQYKNDAIENILSHNYMKQILITLHPTHR
jgi:hypothetical protein